MGQDHREVLEIEKLTAETEKLTVETNKLRVEVEKVIRETVVAKKTGLRFWIGTVGVPLFVAGVTFTAFFTSHYFDALRIEHRNAEFAFQQDTISFSFKKDSLRREEYSLSKTRDSISQVVTKVTKQLASLRADSTNTSNLIASLRHELSNGVTPNTVVNALARRVDSLQNIVYTQNRAIDDNTEKKNFVASLLNDMRHENSLLIDSIGKIYEMHRRFLMDDYDLMVKRAGRLESDVGTQKQYVKMLLDSISSLNRKIRK